MIAKPADEISTALTGIPEMDLLGALIKLAFADAHATHTARNAMAWPTPAERKEARWFVKSMLPRICADVGLDASYLRRMAASCGWKMQRRSAATAGTFSGIMRKRGLLNGLGVARVGKQIF